MSSKGVFDWDAEAVVDAMRIKEGEIAYSTTRAYSVVKNADGSFSLEDIGAADEVRSKTSPTKPFRVIVE